MRVFKSIPCPVCGVHQQLDLRSQADVDEVYHLSTFECIECGTEVTVNAEVLAQFVTSYREPRFTVDRREVIGGAKCVCGEHAEFRSHEEMESFQEIHEFCETEGSLT